MTFGKDQNAKKESIKAINKKKESGVCSTPEFSQHVSDALKLKWQDPEYRNKCLKHLKNIDVNRSDAGKNSRLYENEIAKNIVADKVYYPNEVCDRIVVRNGKIYFVEIKRKDTAGQRLKPKQIEFKEIAKDNYEVIYG